MKERRKDIKERRKEGRILRNEGWKDMKEGRI